MKIPDTYSYAIRNCLMIVFNLCALITTGNENGGIGAKTAFSSTYYYWSMFGDMLMIAGMISGLIALHQKHKNFQTAESIGMLAGLAFLFIGLLSIIWGLNFQEDSLFIMQFSANAYQVLSHYIYHGTWF